jgi:MFS family permease
VLPGKGQQRVRINRGPGGRDDGGHHILAATGTVLFIGGAITLICGVLFFPIVDLKSFPLALLIVSVALCGAQFGNAAQGALFAEAFPTRVRYTGSALSLTGASLIFSAPIPFIASWLLSIGQGTVPITIFWVVTVAIALVSLYLMREGKTLEGKTQYFGTGRLSR